MSCVKKRVCVQIYMLVVIVYFAHCIRICEHACKTRSEYIQGSNRSAPFPAELLTVFFGAGQY